MKTCEVDNCNKPGMNKGLLRFCSMHYTRMRNHGSFELPPRGRRREDREAEMDAGVLTCTKCGETKVLSEFTPVPSRPKLRYASWCKKCTAVASLARHRQDPTVARNGMLRRNYGITIDEYNAMLEEQGGVCAICGDLETRTTRGKVTRLCVDHDHITGRVRGLLCHWCNVTVGFVENHPEIDKVLGYLEEH